MDNYVKGVLLGRGSFGSAFLATSKKDGKKYVIKEIDVSRMQKKEREAAEQEAKVSSVPGLLSHSTFNRVLAGSICCERQQAGS